MSAIHEMMNYTFVSRYSQWLPEQNRRETWKEAVERNRQMMLGFYKDKQVEEDINWAYDFLEKKKVLGSQRNLQFGGKAVLAKNARQYNCVGSYCDRLQFFPECFWLLLCGCGTGFSVQKHHINRLPNLTTNTVTEYVNRPVKEFIIPDTIEGWADSVAVLLTCYFDVPVYDRFKDYVGTKPLFKFHKIRKKGSPLSSGIGKAPGPEGLKISLQKIDALLLSVLQNGSDRISPINAYDIVMHISDAVLSGGVRRSASLCLFSHDDEDMIRAKTGNWREENPQRARSNNSVALLRESTTLEDFQNLIKYTREQYGEPGFIWLEDLEFIVNPCCEITFWCYFVENQELFDKYIKTYNKRGFTQSLESIGLKSGWQACNLSSVKCAQLKDKEDFFDRCKAGAIIGTLQAGLSNFNYLDDVSKKIIDREALLGVSLNGVMENPDIVLSEDVQREAAEIVKKTNRDLAARIGINVAARTTCVKPEGTSATMLGISSGIHPHHSKRYLRRIQANTSEPIYQYFKSLNPIACDRSVWSNNSKDDVISFPIEIPDGAKTKNQTPALELLDIVRRTQQNWVKYGKNEELCTRPELEHNVSNTIVVMEEEWEDVTKYIYENRDSFCGISLISHSGDKDYPQAPFTTVYTPKEIVKEYGDAALWTSGLIELALQSFDNLWHACDFALIDKQQENARNSLKLTSKSNEYMETSKKFRLVEKMQSFANKYFEDDLRKLTYCMKDVYNWKLYCDIEREFKPVDYTLLTEQEDNTVFEQEVTCSGGACLI